ncbi:hypothetical protein TNCV_4523271 [Trichonephila clavipes]|nr:hypothetical protein TNCV_4523271 [Trichonephila clavipes]
MHAKSIESSNVLPLVWCGSWERECQLKRRPRHLSMARNYKVRRQKPSRVAKQCDVNILFTSGESLLNKTFENTL